MARHDEMIQRAEHELHEAKGLLDGGEESARRAVERACACADHSLRAHLAAHNQESDESDMELVLDACGEIDDSIFELFDSISTLKFYLSAFSEESLESAEVGLNDSVEAVRLAGLVFDFVVGKIKPVH